MTLAELHSNEELRRHEFPVVTDKIFMAHAAVCALPRRVTEAMRRYLERAEREDQEDALAENRIRETRQLAAHILGGVQLEEIALVGPTSLALSFVAAGFPAKPGQNVVIYHDDYPSNVYPWMALATRGVEVRLVNVRELGRITPTDVEAQLNDRTALVALASCHFISGHRLDLAAINQTLRSRSIAFCVDGIQTAGAFPTEAAQCDFLAADAHKWLLGPCAAGIFYVRKEWQRDLAPTVFGWHNVRCPGFVARDHIEFPPDARRYEAGTANLVGLVGLQAALELILEIGVENIGRELLRKRAWLVPALQAKGYEVLGAKCAASEASGIVSCWRPDIDLTAVHQRLSEHKVVVSLRKDRSGKFYLRFSPHFYNTDAELQRAVELL
jgi:selenocysteine lyase/cysteine desulfurase